VALCVALDMATRAFRGRPSRGEPASVRQAEAPS
jgi:hypothetical protein